MLMLEQPLKRTDDEIASIAKIVAESYDNDELRNTFVDLLLQLLVHSCLLWPRLSLTMHQCG